MDLLNIILIEQPRYSYNIIDWMWRVFIEDVELKYMDRLGEIHLEKYRKMFKEDLENSRKNYKFVQDLVIDRDCCIIGKTSQNHIDFFEAVMKGAIKNIKRDFNLELPDSWN